MTTRDTFRDGAGDITGPASSFFDITPDDDTEFTNLTRAVYVGTSGDLVAVDEAGVEATFVGIQGMLPIRCKKVLATGTTATDIVGLY